MCQNIQPCLITIENAVITILERGIGQQIKGKSICRVFAYSSPRYVDTSFELSTVTIGPRASLLSY